MQQVSTSLTLFLKVFLPLFWIAFFFAFTIAIWLLDARRFAGLPIESFRIGMVFFLLVGIGFFYWTVLRLKRVEMDKDVVFVTNYFKHVKYPWSNIENIKERDYTLFRTVHITLKTSGIFGKKITFVASRRKFNAFVKENPALFEPFA